MALYWVGGSGDWNDTSNWSETSGGTPTGGLVWSDWKTAGATISQPTNFSNRDNVLVRDNVYASAPKSSAASVGYFLFKSGGSSGSGGTTLVPTSPTDYVVTLGSNQIYPRFNNTADFKSNAEIQGRLFVSGTSSSIPKVIVRDFDFSEVPDSEQINQLQIRAYHYQTSTTYFVDVIEMRVQYQGGQKPNRETDAIFDANSFSTGSTVTINSDAYCKDFSSSAVDQTVSFNFNNDSILVVSGNMETAPTDSFNGTIIYADSGTKTVSVVGSDMGSMIFNSNFYGGFSSATWTLSNATASDIQILAGSLDIASKTINVGSWDALGGSLTAASSTINLSGTFYGGGKTYATLKAITNSTIRQSNTINTLESNPGITITFESGSTQTITNWEVSGTSGNRVLLRSTGSIAQFTLSKASGIVRTDYLDIKNSNATGGASWFAGNNSIDSGGN